MNANDIEKALGKFQVPTDQIQSEVLANLLLNQAYSKVLLKNQSIILEIMSEGKTASELEAEFVEQVNQENDKLIDLLHRRII